MPSLNYERGLKKLKANVQKKLTLTKDALELLSKLCNDLNSKLVEESKSDFKAHKRSKDDEMTHQNAQNAVKKLFKSRVRDFAVAEGQKAVFMYTNKLLVFDEKKALVQEPRDIKQALRPIRPRPPGSEYNRGLTELLATIHPFVGLTTKAKSYLGHVMNDVCRMLITGATETARRTSTLGPEDITVAVGVLFGPTMRDHAYTEGMHAVGLYHRGFYIFTPKKRRLVVAHEPPKKRKLHLAAGDLQLTKRTTFTTGIKNLAANALNGYQLEKSALQKMNYLLTLILQKLSISAINRSIEDDIIELDPIAMQNAVREILPGALSFYAQAEGERAITLYHERLIPFRPHHVSFKDTDMPHDGKQAAKRPRKRPKKTPKAAEPSPQEQFTVPPKKKKKKLIALDFTGPLRILLAEIHELGTFNRSAGELLNKALIDLTKRMTEVAVGKAKDSKELNPQHVQSALKELFPGKMQGLAISEANKAVALFAQKGKKDHSSRVKELDATTTDSTAPPATSAASAEAPSSAEEEMPVDEQPMPPPPPEAESGET